MSCFSGDWVRTHDEHSARLFLAEQAMVNELAAARRARTRRFVADVRAWVRERFGHA